jgi:peptidoglycan/LPS O-acetylase OafA/YrhL
MNEVTAKSSGRIVELDALRALAAINLMLFHFTYVYQVKFGFSSPLNFQYPFGKYGVQLFFMLSGFVNAMTLLRKREADSFLAARMIRILPSFYLLVGLNLVLLTLAPLSSEGGYSLAQVGANLTLMPNLLGFECLEPVTWTLQIELLFYVILMLLFLSGGMDRPFRPLMLYLLLCLIGGKVVLQMPVGNNDLSSEVILLMGSVMLFKYMPLFCIGLFLYLLKSDWDSKWKYLIGIGTSAIVFHLIDDHGHNPAATVLLIGLLAMAAFGKVPVLRSPFFVFLSGISYSLYLSHNNLGCVLMHQLDRLGIPPILCFAFAMAFSVLIAAAMTRYFERPMSGWLNAKWKKIRPVLSRSGTVPLVGSTD